MTDVRRISAAVAVTLGAILLILLLWALLDVARFQQLQSGEEFARAASRLRLLVIGEVGGLIVMVGLVLWRVGPLTSKLIVLAAAVWGLSLADAWLLALGGSIPR